MLTRDVPRASSAQARTSLGLGQSYTSQGNTAHQNNGCRAPGRRRGRCPSIKPPGVLRVFDWDLEKRPLIILSVSKRLLS